MGTFAMVLDAASALRPGRRRPRPRCPRPTQGWGYLTTAAGPLLVGILRGVTGGYTGMFVLVLAGSC